MKPANFLFPLALLGLTACAVPPPPHKAPPEPETVMITYHVKPDKEAEFEDALVRAWELYRKEDLVIAGSHTVVRSQESGDKTRVTEIFSWVSHDVPDHAPESVKKIWDELQSLCEARDGHGALEGGEVELLTPVKK